MSTTLLTPPTHTSPASVLRISQQAPGIFRSLTPTKLPYPLSLLFSSESAEKWTTLENLLLACLRTGDNESAYLCLEELTDRFGANNERVQALNGLYREATARDDKALEEVLRSYEDVLKETPTNMPIRKRRVALLRSMGRVGDAIGALRELLDASPIDAEAWSELADMYISQGAYSQAIFCLEEVLLITPNAWNVSLSLLIRISHLHGSCGNRGTLFSSWVRMGPVLLPLIEGHFGMGQAWPRHLPHDFIIS